MIFKAKEKVFDDLSEKKHKGFTYQFVDEKELLTLFKTVQPSTLEKLCNCYPFGPDRFILIPKELKEYELFFRRKQQKGRPVKLLNGENWLITTIADVHSRFAYNDKFELILKPDDPLFDKLIDFSLHIADKSTEEVIDLIADCLSRNYYLTKEMLIALQLLDVETILAALDVIYLKDDVKKQLEEGADTTGDLFRCADEYALGESDSEGLLDTTADENAPIQAEGSD